MYLTETVSKCSIWDKITNSYNSFWITLGEWRGVYVRMLKDRKVRTMKNIFLPFIFFLKKKKTADWGPQKRHYTLSGLILDPHILNPLASILMICNSFRDQGLSFQKKKLLIFFWVVLNIISEQQYFFEGSLDRVHAK